MGIKIQKRKFIRNIIIGIIALIIVAFIINIAPGYKRDKYKDVINLVIGDTNVTEKLSKPIYKDKEGTIYISKEDIKELLDKTLYYDTEENMLIATSEVSVASMQLGEKIIRVNGSINDTLDTIIQYDDTIYIPIEEMEIVYNIEVKYLEEQNIVIIDKLNEGMIKAETDEKTKIRFKPRSLSKNIGELEVGSTVYAFYTTSKGWRLIRTEDGIVGYVKANVLTNEYIIRQDMKQNTETKTISSSTDDNTTVNIDGDNVLIKDLLKLTDEGVLIKNIESSNNTENNKIWANLELTNVDLSSYSNRTSIIKNIVNIARKNDISGVNIILENNENSKERFIIELSPLLREIGILTNIVIDNNIDINTENYQNIVNYIIKK